MKAFIVGKGPNFMRSLAFARKVLKAKHRYISFLSKEESSLWDKGIFPMVKDPSSEKEINCIRGDFSYSFDEVKKEVDVIILASPFWDSSFEQYLQEEKKDIFFRGLLKPGEGEKISHFVQKHSSHFYYLPCFSFKGFEVLDEEKPTFLYLGCENPKQETNIFPLLGKEIKRKGRLFSFDDLEKFMCSYLSYFVTKDLYKIEIAKSGKRNGFNADFINHLLNDTPLCPKGGNKYVLFPYGEEGFFAASYVFGEKFLANHKENLQFFIKQYTEYAQSHRVSIALLGLGEEKSEVRKSALYFAKNFLEKGILVRAYDPFKENAITFKKSLPDVRVFERKEETLMDAVPLYLLDID